MAQIRTLDAALESVTDGIMLAVPREQSGVAMEATRALIRRGVRDLHPGTRCRPRPCRRIC